MENTEKYMRLALKEAQKAYDKDEVPIGAVIVKGNKVIAKAHNLRESSQISTHHAEILAIEKACKKLGTWRLENCEMYVTLEPCPMCAGAIMQSRMDKIIFGAYDKKGGSIITNLKLFNVKGFNHYPKIEHGVLENECALLLRNFFKMKR